MDTSVMCTTDGFLDCAIGAYLCGANQTNVKYVWTKIVLSELVVCVSKEVTRELASSFFL